MVQCWNKVAAWRVEGASEIRRNQGISPDFVSYLVLTPAVVNLGPIHREVLAVCGILAKVRNGRRVAHDI